MRTAQICTGARRLTAFFLFLFACASLQAAGLHSLWKVQGKHNTVYLLGSVHLLGADEVILDVMEAAYRDANALVMEIDMDDMDLAESQATTLQLGLLPNGTTLQDVIGPDASTQLAAYATSVGIDATMLARFRPWFAAITLTQMQLMKLGLDAQNGIEMRFTQKAIADKKPITGFETVAEQLGYFAELSDREQTQFLLYTLDEAERAEAEFGEILAAWRTGNGDTLAGSMEKEAKDFPNLYTRLTIDRNRRWLGPIEKLLSEQQNYLVIVGAFHLVGKDGVVDLLQKRGYQVTQQ